MNPEQRTSAEISREETIRQTISNLESRIENVDNAYNDNSDLKELEKKDTELLAIISSINQTDINRVEKERLIGLTDTIGDQIHDLIVIQKTKVKPSESIEKNEPIEITTSPTPENDTETNTINESLNDSAIPDTKTDQDWVFQGGEKVEIKKDSNAPEIEDAIRPNTAESLPNTEYLEKKFLNIIQELNNENTKPIYEYKEDASDFISRLNDLWDETEKSSLKKDDKNALLSNIGEAIDKIYKQTDHLPYKINLQDSKKEVDLDDKKGGHPDTEIDWNAVLQASYDKENTSPNIPPTYKEGVENILAAKKETDTPFKEADINETSDLLLTDNLDLNSHIAETSYAATIRSSNLENIDLPFNPSTRYNAEEINEYLDKQPPAQKEKTIRTLNTLGYQIDKWKNEKIADLLEKSASTLVDPNKVKKELRDQSTLTRFLHGLAKGRRLKAEQTENTIKNIQAGKTGLLAQAGNLGRPIGTALKVGRILGDFNIANPLRHVMLIASTTEEISRGAKEARLSSDAVLRKQTGRREERGVYEKTQDIENKYKSLPDQIEASLEGTTYGSVSRKMRSYDDLKSHRKRLQKVARGIAKNSKKIQGRSKEDSLKHNNTFARKLENKSLEAGDLNALDHARLLLSNTAQGIAQWQNKFWLDRVQKKLNKIESSSLSIEKKETRKQKLFASYENKLKDMERMMSGYGAIDTLAMAARNVENASKAAVIGMMADSLYKAGKYAYENDMFGFMDWAEKIIEEEKNTPDDLDSYVLPINPTYTEPIKVSLADSEKILEPETIKKSRFSLFENTGASVIEDPQGKVSVTYEIGKNGDFNFLDQALRRVVMQAYDDQTPNVFDKVEAARLENTLANVREILQGQTINGITPLQIKESAQLVDGNLVISDYNKFDQEILKPLFKRATEKIDQDSPIIKYSQATNESVWQEMLSEKNGSKTVSIEPGFAKEVTPPENLPSEFTDNEIKGTSIPVETNILNGSRPIEDLKQVEIETPAPRLLDKVSSDIQTRFRLPEESANQIVNTLMIDSNGNLDQNQLQIFNDIINRTQNPDAIFSALDITRGIDWDSAKEMKLAQAFVNPEKINLWQDVFGKDMVPENAKVKIDGTKLSLHKVGGMGGALSIDFAEQKITLGRLLRPGGNGWATNSARFFHFSPSSQTTFGEALGKATQAVRQAK